MIDTEGTEPFTGVIRFMEVVAYAFIILGVCGMIYGILGLMS